MKAKKLLHKFLCFFGFHVENFTARENKSCYYCKTALAKKNKK